MKIFADFHIHSRYSRACSKDLTPANLSLWAKKKGIQVLGTGDFTHPKWVNELEESFEESLPGLYCLRGEKTGPYFLFTAEVASIYKQGDKTRRVHNLLFAPSLEAVKKVNNALEKRGANLKSDGRPIFKITCEELMKLCKDADSRMEIIPAHAWTPHFGIFGSMSGFNSIGEAFGDYAKYVFAIETGLSSDPKMNWQVGQLNNIALISNSDAHSLRKLGREANVFEIAENELSFDKIIKVIKNNNPKDFLNTIEFFPEEGKYHLDGHADCKFSCLPRETKKMGDVCPKCGKKLLKGVLNRVEMLSDRVVEKGRIPYKSIIPLEEVIAESMGVGVNSKKVVEAYEKMVSMYSEFNILLDLERTELEAISNQVITESVLRVREGRVSIEPGYDGIFGKIEIYTNTEREKILKKPKQIELF